MWGSGSCSLFPVPCYVQWNQGQARGDLSSASCKSMKQCEVQSKVLDSQRESNSSSGFKRHREYEFVNRAQGELCECFGEFER